RGSIIIRHLCAMLDADKVLRELAFILQNESDCERGSIIIRHLCAMLDADKVLRELAFILQNESDCQFAATIVPTLSLILLTTPPLSPDSLPFPHPHSDKLLFFFPPLPLFSTHRRGSIIIRHLCAMLDADKVLRELAFILQNESDCQFAATIVPTLSLILLTAPELAPIRSKLLSLCLLAQAYEHAWCIVDALEESDLSLSLMVQVGGWREASVWGASKFMVDALEESDLSLSLMVQAYEHAWSIVDALEESELSLSLMVQLLDPSRSPALLKALYGLLMLLPQVCFYMQYVTLMSATHAPLHLPPFLHAPLFVPFLPYPFSSLLTPTHPFPPTHLPRSMEWPLECYTRTSPPSPRPSPFDSLFLPTVSHPFSPLPTPSHPSSQHGVAFRVLHTRLSTVPSPSMLHPTPPPTPSFPLYSTSSYLPHPAIPLTASFAPTTLPPHLSSAPASFSSKPSSRSSSPPPHSSLYGPLPHSHLLSSASASVLGSASQPISIPSLSSNAGAAAGTGSSQEERMGAGQSPSAPSATPTATATAAVPAIPSAGPAFPLAAAAMRSASFNAFLSPAASASAASPAASAAAAAAAAHAVHSNTADGSAISQTTSSQGPGMGGGDDGRLGSGVGRGGVSLSQHGGGGFFQPLQQE
ncbi:unnamed protein product, partial [Closterium sp. NIES-64]